MVGGIAGTMEVFFLALLNPLAGLFLAIHTWQIKYTSQVMLEAIPALTSLVAVLAYRKSKSRWNGWMVLTAVTFGLAVAAKYPYGLVGLVILGHWLWSTFPREEQKTPIRMVRWLRPAILWLLLSFVVFFLFDPYLWPDPINRLKDSLLYHGGYATSEAVQETGYPMWQQLNWLFESVPWSPGVFLFSFDLGIAILAGLGLPRLWRKQRVFALWFLMVLAFLLIWPTKWPQYVLMLTAPLTFSAAEGFQQFITEPIFEILKRAWTHKASRVKQRSWNAKDNRRALPWMMPGLVALGVITLFPLIYQGAMAITDFNILSIRDGLRGGVMREAWLGLTGQVDPVQLSIDQQGRIQSTDVVADRGEVRHLNTTRTTGIFNGKDVHYSGFNILTGVFQAIGGDVIVFELLWTFLTVGLQTAFGLLVAMALTRRGIRFARWWRTIYILPWAIPEFIGALVWLNAFEHSNGWVSLLLMHPFNWAQNANMSLVIMVFCAVWLGWPFMMLAATAGLKALSKEVYDAAAIDGASGWLQFRSITWPLVLPLLAPAILIRSIFAFNQFYLFYVLNPPLSTFASISYYLFNTNTGAGLFSISAALNIIAVCFLLGIIVWLNRWNRAAEEASYA
jgi:ABC-type sugar transport system permease subunit